jgi:hypothetical protein
LKAKTGKNIGLQFQIVASKILAEPIIIKDKKIKIKAQSMEKTKYIDTKQAHYKCVAQCFKIS